MTLGAGFVTPPTPTPSDVNALFTSVNAAMLRMQSDNSLIYPKLAAILDGSSGVVQPNEQGTGSGDPNAGETVLFPFSPVTNPPKVWSFGTDRKSVPAVVAWCKVTRRRYAPDLEEIYYDTLSQDRYAILANKLPAIMDRAPRLWDYLVAQMLADNPILAQDNQPLFGTHFYNPNKPSLGQTSNDIPIAGIDPPEMAKVLRALGSVRGYDGQILNSGANTKIVIVVPNEEREREMAQVFNAQTYAQQMGANAAATPQNTLVGKATILLFKDLQNNPADPDGKIGYAFSLPDSVNRSIIISAKRQPLAAYEGLNPNDRSRIDTGGIRYGWDAFGGVGPGLWQNAVRFTITP